MIIPSWWTDEQVQYICLKPIIMIDVNKYREREKPLVEDNAWLYHVQEEGIKEWENHPDYRDDVLYEYHIEDSKKELTKQPTEQKEEYTKIF